MPELGYTPLHIHKAAPNKSEYGFDKKLFDFISLASAPGLSSSNAIYKRIQRKLDFEVKKTEKLKGFKMNGFDEHLFNSSELNEGQLTKEVIEDYAKSSFSSDEARNAFLDYAKTRLGYLAFLGLLNDVSESDNYHEEKTTSLDKEGKKEHTVKVKLNFTYEINNNFYKYLLTYQQKKELELKEKFEFGKFDAFIYNYIQKVNGCINLDNVKKEKINEAIEKASKVIYQARLMKEMGYLEEDTPDIFTFNKGFKKKLDSGAPFLNATEKKIVEFIQRHGVFSLEKYRIDHEVEAESNASILKNRLDKLIKLGYLHRSKDTYSFTTEGENRLKGFYAENYEFTSFDRNILNSNVGGLIDLEEIEAELENRYGSTSAAQTLERQKERLFIMECAGLIKRESSSIYSLTGKGTSILDEENRVYTKEKCAVLQQTFKYSYSDDEFYELLKSKGGIINPANEINAILDIADKENGMYEVNAYNMIMRNYKSLGTADIDAGDEVKLHVKLGYIVQNHDGTLSLTPKGKSLVNAVNSKDDEKKLKAFSNKKFKLLNDIDKSCNRLDPKIYIKTQRIISDKEQRKRINLLRYKPENLHLLGLLDKNEDSSYSINPLFEKYSSEFRQQKLQDEIGSFNFSNVHKYMFKFCRDNKFSLERYKQYISQKLSGKDLDREMYWKKSSCEKLTMVGYFEKIDDTTYRLTDKGISKLKEIRDGGKAAKLEKYKVEKEEKLKEFKPGANHKYLLKFAENGILDFKDVENRILKLPKSKQARELTMKKGMLGKLAAAGYLEALDSIIASQDGTVSRIETSIFRLTPKAVMFMEGKSDTEPEIATPTDNEQASEQPNADIEPVKSTPSIDNSISTHEEVKEVEVKITKFDLDNIVYPSVNGILLKSAVEQSPKKASVLKRINTLAGTGMIVESDNGWTLTQELFDRAKVRNNINIEHQKSHTKLRSLECLTVEQKKTIHNMKDFLNLTGNQILKYIYEGNEKLYKPDMSYLIRKGIIEKDKLYDIYVFTKQGSKLAAELTGDAHVFNSKINSRRQELKHDILIYTAFKDAEKKLKDQGKVITSVKTDRKLKSEDMKTTKRMNSEYPDLHIEYEDKTTGEKGFINIEVDVGYSEKVIAKKLKIPNLKWYTDSQRQKDKVLKKARYMEVQIIGEEYWRR